MKESFCCLIQGPFSYSFELKKLQLASGHHPTSAMIPIALGNLSNIVASGDENGNVYVWRSVEAIKDNVGVNLTGHTAHI